MSLVSRADKKCASELLSNLESNIEGLTLEEIEKFRNFRLSI